MNDDHAEDELRDYYQSITPAGSVRVTRLVDTSIRERREARGRRTYSLRPRIYAGLAAALSLIIVAAVCFSTWSADTNNGYPAQVPGSPSGGTSLPSATSGPTTTPAPTPTPRPSPTLRAPTNSTPSRHFSPTGSMNGRFDTATLLADGRVLMTGDSTLQMTGNSEIPVYTTAADLYDPATGTFTPTGPMVHVQSLATVTRLKDGRVLIAGGVYFSLSPGGDTILSTAQLYDPATGRFSTTGSMIEPRDRHTATLLNTGEVLIAGGETMSGFSATAELYDPSSGTFKPTGPMTASRVKATAALLGDGRVWIMGGSGRERSSPNFTTMGGPSLNSTEIYDPASGAFSTAGTMDPWRQGFIVTPLRDGRLLTEGSSDSAAPPQCRLYDPTTGRFGPAGTMTHNSNPALLLDGTVLFAGGFYAPMEGYLQPTEQPRGVGYVSSVGGGRYDFGPPSPAVGAGARTTVVNAPPQATAQLYDPSTGKFTQTGSMGKARGVATATLLLDGRVLIAGGDLGTGRTAELYQP